MSIDELYGGSCTDSSVPPTYSVEFILRQEIRVLTKMNESKQREIDDLKRQIKELEGE